jgi:uncharacterized protein
MDHELWLGPRTEVRVLGLPERRSDFLGPDDVEDLAAGTALLASGGGGDTEVTAILLRAVLAERGPVRLVDAVNLGGDDLVVPVGLVGAVAVMAERLPSEREFTTAIRTLERYLGRPAIALHGFESGGVNTMLPVACAAWLDLPLVDADGMGRTFPRLEQTVFTVAGIPATPTVLSCASGDTLVITEGDNWGVERMARAVLPALGGWAAAATYAMSARDAAQVAITGTISGPLQLGRTWRHLQEHGDRDARAEALAGLGGVLCFSGTVLEVIPRTAGALGIVTLEDRVERSRTLRVEMGDEYLLAVADGEVIARVPDIICLLDARTWRVVSTERVAIGQQLELLCLPPPDPWSKSAADELVGPSAFGLAAPKAGPEPRYSPRQS